MDFQEIMEPSGLPLSSENSLLNSHKSAMDLLELFKESVLLELKKELSQKGSLKDLQKEKERSLLKGQPKEKEL